MPDPNQNQRSINKMNSDWCLVPGGQLYWDYTNVKLSACPANGERVFVFVFALLRLEKRQARPANGECVSASVIGHGWLTAIGTAYNQLRKSDSTLWSWTMQQCAKKHLKNPPPVICWTIFSNYLIWEMSSQFFSFSLSLQKYLPSVPKGAIPNTDTGKSAS